MTLSWNEIKDRAVQFSKEWETAVREQADAKPFLTEFFNVFGISSKRVATFEYSVRKLDETHGYIDLLWKGAILVEMKSKGKSLDKAFGQAKDYMHGLKDYELPKLVLVCNFEKFRLYDLEEDHTTEFALHELVNHVQHFGFLIGYQKKIYAEQDPANIKAAELLGKLHDRLEEIGYTGHALEVYLVRILFCLFAEDTTIFNKQQFQNYIEQRTGIDGADLAPKLQALFQVLNTPTPQRFTNLDEQLADFPYINGKLFEEILPTASFDSKMRQALLNCCYLDWSKISPAIFGSMFQSVMNPKERRNLGAHYTSETNILKLIKPLFLDELWQEFERVKDHKNKLNELHQKISSLTFLDPACGCGNFLVITYRQLRLLELEILRTLHRHGQRFLDVSQIIQIDVDRFYGIEYEEFPAQIAQVAMWLVDHQMNMLFSNEFGQYFIRLPLTKAANIVHGDAMEIDWQNLLNPLNSIDIIARHTNIYMADEPPAEYKTVNVQTQTVAIHRGKTPPQTPLQRFNYILGNPPFIGSKLMQPIQRSQIIKQFNHAEGSGVLDYVSGWYIKAAKYIQSSQTKVAFVSTNSIVQGEQVAILWGVLLHQYHIKIHFAHRTFKWSNEAKGNAAVYCVIIGFAAYDTPDKSIFEYENIKGEPHQIKAANINPYLVDAQDVIIGKRTTAICPVPTMLKGSQPTDGGNFLLTEEEKADFLAKEPDAAKYIKPLISAHEFLNGEKRYCFWLVDANPSELRKMPHLLKRIEKVKAMRLKSSKPATVKWANQPTLFTENRQPQSNYILVPSHSSENRWYIPMGFMTQNDILNNSCLSVPNGTLYHFGVLMSAMHMAWVNAVCGRIKSDFRYSVSVVYNNFPWHLPQQLTPQKVAAIEQAAQKVLDIRAMFANSSPADLYHPLLMPDRKSVV